MAFGLILGLTEIECMMIIEEYLNQVEEPFHCYPVWLAIMGIFAITVNKMENITLCSLGTYRITVRIKQIQACKGSR
jgi:hypothetical protein